MGKSKKINSWLVKGKNTCTLLRVTADILVKRIGGEKSDGQIENDGERERKTFLNLFYVARIQGRLL